MNKKFKVKIVEIDHCDYYFLNDGLLNTTKVDKKFNHEKYWILADVIKIIIEKE